MAERFYVYRFTDSDGVAYVGKGSGKRVEVQARRFGYAGEIISRHKSEAAAYKAERAAIAAMKPRLNIHPGGNGSRAQKVVERQDAWDKQFALIGSRPYAARLLLRLGAVKAQDIPAMEKVAYARH